MDEHTVTEYVDEVDTFIKNYSHLDVHLFRKWRQLKEYVDETRLKAKEARRQNAKLERKIERMQGVADADIEFKDEQIKRLKKECAIQVNNDNLESPDKIIQQQAITIANLTAKAMEMETEAIMMRMRIKELEKNQLSDHSTINELVNAVKHPKQHVLVACLGTVCRVCKKTGCKLYCSSCPDHPGLHKKCSVLYEHKE
uniref:Uncharacterized protein n=1 Tax=Clandestinovirus TaxID=2831644 RepID=A0A8F8PKC7_9VIRU|nr:hypothetical protein KOM_12_610 [Clandestinovirus]